MKTKEKTTEELAYLWSNLGMTGRMKIIRRFNLPINFIRYKFEAMTYSYQDLIKDELIKRSKKDIRSINITLSIIAAVFILSMYINIF